MLTGLDSFLPPLPPGRPALVLGLGVFDGVHCGHRRIIARAAELAAECGALPAAVTFSPHPRAVLCPEDPPCLLQPPEVRREMLLKAGARWTGVVEFSRAVAGMEPEAFLQELASAETFRLSGIVVGENWRFGREGRGNCAFLKECAGKMGFRFAACPVVKQGGEVVSSSAIRRHVAAGELDTASRMLGARVTLYGTIGHGYAVARTKLNAPTANLQLEYGVLPPDGVYCAAAEVEGKVYASAVNCGVSPTFGYADQRRRVEVHCLDFDGDLYGKKMELKLLSFLRPERKFSSPEELKSQIAKDIAAIRARFAGEGA